MTLRMDRNRWFALTARIVIPVLIVIFFGVRFEADYKKNIAGKEDVYFGTLCEFFKEQIKSINEGNYLAYIRQGHKFSWIRDTYNDKGTYILLADIALLKRIFTSKEPLMSNKDIYKVELYVLWLKV